MLSYYNLLYKREEGGINMFLVTNIVKAIKKEERNERAKDLAFSSRLGCCSGCSYVTINCSKI